MTYLMIYLIGIPIWFVVTSIFDDTADVTHTLVNLFAYTFAALLWPIFLCLTILAVIATVGNSIGDRLRG